MTLTNLHVGGFRCFREPIDVPLRPVTLIFGENSSGKTTLLQAIKLLSAAIHPPEGYKGISPLVGQHAASRFQLTLGDPDELPQWGTTQVAAAFSHLQSLPASALHAAGLAVDDRVLSSGADVPALELGLGVGIQGAADMRLSWRWVLNETDDGSQFEPQRMLQQFGDLGNQEGGSVKPWATPIEWRLVPVQDILFYDNMSRHYRSEYSRHGDEFADPIMHDESMANYDRPNAYPVRGHWEECEKGKGLSDSCTLGPVIARLQHCLGKMATRREILTSDSDHAIFARSMNYDYSNHPEEGKKYQASCRWHLSSQEYVEGMMPIFSWGVSYGSTKNGSTKTFPSWRTSAEWHDRVLSVIGASVSAEMVRRQTEYSIFTEGMTGSVEDMYYSGRDLHVQPRSDPEDAMKLGSARVGSLLCPTAIEQFDSDGTPITWPLPAGGGEFGDKGEDSMSLPFFRGMTAIGELAVIALLGSDPDHDLGNDDEWGGMEKVVETWGVFALECCRIIGDQTVLRDRCRHAVRSERLIAISEEADQFLVLLGITKEELAGALEIDYCGSGGGKWDDYIEPTDETENVPGEWSPHQITERQLTDLPSVDETLQMCFSEAALDRLDQNCVMASSPSRPEIVNFAKKALFDGGRNYSGMWARPNTTALTGTSIEPSFRFLQQESAFAKDLLSALVRSGEVPSAGVMMYAWLADESNAWDSRDRKVDILLNPESAFEDFEAGAQAISSLSAERGIELGVIRRSGGEGLRGQGLNQQVVPRLRDPKVCGHVNAWMSRLGIDYVVEHRETSELGIPYEKIVFFCSRSDPERKRPMAWSEIGFGVSQVLPVILSVVCAERTVLIDEPEASVHPRLQAELGTLLAEATAHGNSGKQCIVATHSEHLVLRMMRLIRLGKIVADDVSIIYVSRDENGSHAKRLRLDERGDFIDEWPGGFFDDRLNELVGGEEGL